MLCGWRSRHENYIKNDKVIIMPYLNVLGIKLHFIDEGEGNSLFLLHGNAGSAAVWRKVIPALRLHYRVVAHDRQGFGNSEKIESGNFSPRSYAEELARLMDTLRVEKVHVCGISFGGMVAQCFALDFPDRTEGLILVGTTPDRTGRNVPETLAELERDGWPAVAERLTRSWFRFSSNPEDIAEAYAVALQSSQRMRELTVSALGSFDIKDKIASIRAHTLILVGEQDTTCPLSHAQMLKDRIPHSRLIQIPDCAHLVPVEQPEVFCRHTIAFLDEIDQNIKASSK
jgi:3-oxoadipate enol-lactonase